MSVLVLGSCVLDIISDIRDTTYGKKMTDINFSLGGMAYNVFNILNLFNNQPIFGCPIGTGKIADTVEMLLKEKNIKPIYKVKDRDNGVCMCFADEDKSNSFISKHGAEFSFNASWFNHINMNDIDYIYISGLDIEDFYGEYFYGNEIIDFLEKANKKILFAMGPRLTHINQEYLDRMYKLHPIIHINEFEAKRISKLDNIEMAADYLYNLCQNTIIITLGERGCYIKNEDSYYVEGYPDIVVNAIGAGDAHAGAILASLSSGIDLKTSAIIANIIASETIKENCSSLSEEGFKKAIKRYHKLQSIALYD